MVGGKLSCSFIPELLLFFFLCSSGNLSLPPSKTLRRKKCMFYKREVQSRCWSGVGCSEHQETQTPNSGIRVTSRSWVIHSFCLALPLVTPEFSEVTTGHRKWQASLKRHKVLQGYREAWLLPFGTNIWPGTWRMTTVWKCWKCKEKGSH